MAIQKTAVFVVPTLSELVQRAEGKTGDLFSERLIVLLASVEARWELSGFSGRSPMSIFLPGILFLKKSFLRFRSV